MGMFAIDPIGPIIDLIKSGNTKKANKELERLRSDLYQHRHYQRRLADLRMTAYVEMSDPLVDFKMYSIRSSVFKEAADINDMAKILVRAYSAAEKYYPFFDWDVRTSIKEIYFLWHTGVNKLNGDISKAEKKVDELREKIALDAGIKRARQLSS